MGPGDPVIEACHILAYCKFPVIKLKPYITFLPPTWFVLTYIVRCKLWAYKEKNRQLVASRRGRLVLSYIVHCKLWASSCLLGTRRRIDN